MTSMFLHLPFYPSPFTVHLLPSTTTSSSSCPALATTGIFAAGMEKPTLLQTILGRPSQTYSLPPEKQYFSQKKQLLRTLRTEPEASGDIQGPSAGETVSALSTLTNIRNDADSHVHL